MTLVLENSWNFKKVQFVPGGPGIWKNLLDKHKKSLKMIETGFWMQCTTKIKRIVKSLIENKVWCCIQRVMPLWYSILFHSSTCSTYRLQPEVKPCKVEIRKCKNESSLRKHYAELKPGRNNVLEGEICLQSRTGKESCI